MTSREACREARAAAPPRAVGALAENKGRNAVHGSDSDENAAIEIAFFFAGTELVG